VQLDVGSRVPIATTAMGVPIFGHCHPTTGRFITRAADQLWQPLGQDARRIERSGETVASTDSPCPTVDWQDDVAAVGVPLRLNDGTGPYAFNCGATGIPLYRKIDCSTTLDLVLSRW